jgi:hypothetical protein
MPSRCSAAIYQLRFFSGNIDRKKGLVGHLFTEPKTQIVRDAVEITAARL